MDHQKVEIEQENFQYIFINNLKYFVMSARKIV